MKQLLGRGIGIGLVVLLAGACTQNNPKYCGGVEPTCGAGDGGVMPLPSCAGPSDCAPSQTCTSAGCADSCSSALDCESQFCLNGFCVPKGTPKVEPKEKPAPKMPATCTEDEQCTDAGYCSEGKCVPRCTSDEQCKKGEVCIACGKCQPEEQPATCGERPAYCGPDAPCGDGKTCVAGRCHYECKTSKTCPVGQVCDAGQCINDPAPGSPECALDVECDAGTCINGYCHAYCGSKADCGDGMVCLIAVCQPDYGPVI